MATDGVSGYTTIQLKCELPDGAANVYAMAGTPETTPMRFPPAFQVPAPFGSDVGGPNPQFIAFNPEVEFDSFLCVGDPNPPAGTLSVSPGPDGADAVAAWGVSESAAIDTTDGALFYMNPVSARLDLAEKRRSQAARN